MGKRPIGNGKNVVPKTNTLKMYSKTIFPDFGTISAPRTPLIKLVGHRRGHRNCLNYVFDGVSDNFFPNQSYKGGAGGRNSAFRFYVFQKHKLQVEIYF